MSKTKTNKCEPKLLASIQGTKGRSFKVDVWKVKVTEIDAGGWSIKAVTAHPESQHKWTRLIIIDPKGYMLKEEGISSLCDIPLSVIEAGSEEVVSILNDLRRWFTK